MSDQAIEIGGQVPSFELPDTSGEVHAIPGGAEAGATVVCWTCNHCPYALAWHERLASVAREYGERGVRFLFVNSNDATRYPADSLDAMRARAEAGEIGAPYLHDEGQDVARAWGALKTPDVFVCDSELVLRYRGAPDTDYNDPSQNAAWLRDALDAVLSEEQPDPEQTEPVGCTIKWRE